MELSTFFEIIGKYGWWSLLMAAGIGLIYILVKFITNKITNGVRGGMDDIATKLTGSVATQLQQMSSTNSSQIEMLSNNIAKQNTELVKAISSQNERLLSYIMNRDIVNNEIHDRYVEHRMDVAESIINELKDIIESFKNRDRRVDEQPYKVGDRLGQIIIMPYPQVMPVEATKLSETERGESGHGSTGR